MRADLRTLLPLVVAAFMLLIYAGGAAPGAWWGDGQELACAARTLGVPHPTGYPLYVLIGHALTRLAPGADAGRLLTLLSALLCAAGLGLTGIAAAVTSRRGDETGTLHETGREGASAPLALVPGVLTLVAGVSLTLWDHATFAEVYPLTFFLVSAILITLGPPPQRTGLRPGLRLALGGAFCGLAAANHYSALAVAPLALAGALRIAYAADGRGVRGGTVMLRYLGLFFVAFALPFCLYLYIPLRAAANPPLNWGNPVGASGLLWVLRGGDFPAWFLRQGAGAGGVSGVARTMDWWGMQFLPLTPGPFARGAGCAIFCAAFAGCAILGRRDRVLSGGLIASLLITGAFPVVYPIADIEAYLLPAIPAAVFGGVALVDAAARSGSGERGRARAILITLCLAVTAMTTLIVRRPVMDKSGDHGPRAWTSAVFAALPPDAAVITAQGRDTEIFSLWEAQMSRGERADVVVFGAGFLFTPWFADHLEHPSRPKIDIALHAREPGSKEVYDAALLGGVVARVIGGRRVFTTFMDDTLRNYMNPTPAARLLPDGYYRATAYRFALPGPVLYELRPSPESLEFWRERYETGFGAEPGDGEPSAGVAHIR